MLRFITTILLALTPLLSSAQALADSTNAANPAPDFALKSAVGQNIRLSEHIGEVILLNFWASWCGPCRQEMPHLDALHSQYGELGFNVMGINLDADTTLAHQVLKDIPVDFTILFDTDNTVSRQYGVDSMPFTVLVDRNGNVRYVHRGYRPGFEDKYEEQIRALVKE